MKLSKEEATAFFATFYRGEHHFPSQIKPYGEGWSMSHFGGLATFDSDELTRLVFLAHDRCIRAQVEQGGPNRLRIAIWKREREGDMYQRHPTIEQALEGWKAGQKAPIKNDVLREVIAERLAEAAKAKEDQCQI